MTKLKLINKSVKTETRKAKRFLERYLLEEKSTQDIIDHIIYSQYRGIWGIIFRDVEDEELVKAIDRAIKTY